MVQTTAQRARMERPGTTELRKYPFIGWDRLKPAIQWKQGQHVVAIGGTGSGKSTLSGELLPRRKQVVVCVSKGMDDIFAGPYFSDYETIGSWGKRKSDQSRVLLRPPNQKTIELTRTHKTEVFRDCFDNILLKEGYWCIDIDESHYMCERLKLGGEVADLMEQGRSGFISVWNNTQRPAGIPLAIYVNSMHGFFFLTQEEYDLQRLSRLGNKHTNVKELSANIQNLDEHEFVYIDKTGRIPPCRSMVIVRGKRNAGATGQRNVQAVR
jgi:energy-coupling factor transporter ATP-binding protein EcfA2